MQIGVNSRRRSDKPVMDEPSDTKEIVLLLRQINEKLDAIVAMQQDTVALNVVLPERVNEYLSDPQNRKKLAKILREE